MGNLGLPNNPLDVLIDELGGPEKVAEMTGRKGRLVRSKSSRTVTYEARNASGVEKGAQGCCCLDVVASLCGRECLPGLKCSGRWGLEG